MLFDDDRDDTTMYKCLITKSNNSGFSSLRALMFKRFLMNVLLVLLRRVLIISTLTILSFLFFFVSLSHRHEHTKKNIGDPFIWTKKK